MMGAARVWGIEVYIGEGPKDGNCRPRFDRSYAFRN